MPTDDDTIEWGWVDRYFSLRGVWRGAGGYLEPMQKRVRKVQHRLYTTMVMVLANFGAVFLTMLVLYLVGRVDILLLIPMACTVLLTSAALFAVLWLDARDTLAITEEELFVKRYVEEDLRKRGYDTLTLWRELSRRKFGTRR